MTNKEKAQGLWGIVMDRLRELPERRAALEALVDLKKKAKTSLDKLGVPQVMWDREWKALLEHEAMATDMAESAPKPKPPSAMPAIAAGIHAILGGATAAEGAAVAASKAPTPSLKDAMLKAKAHLEGEDTEDGPKPLISEHHLAVAKNGGKEPKTFDELKDDETLFAPEEPKPLTADERGAISKTVRHMLLNTDHPYARMVELIKAKHPSAKTTARSIASVASDMRRAGYEVRERRKDAA